MYNVSWMHFKRTLQNCKVIMDDNSFHINCLLCVNLATIFLKSVWKKLIKVYKYNALYGQM